MKEQLVNNPQTKTRLTFVKSYHKKSNSITAHVFKSRTKAKQWVKCHRPFRVVGMCGVNE